MGNEGVCARAAEGRRAELSAAAAPGAHTPSPAPAVGTARPRHPRKRKSRLVMAHRDRETSGICLKSIKENHYFLEENPLAIKAWRRHPSAANRCLIQNSCTETTPTLPDTGKQPSFAQGTGLWFCLIIAKTQQWVWVSGSPLSFKHP